jgi:phosphatidate phosphatase PAH1
VDVLNKGDTLIIFFSGNCGKIRTDYMQQIKESQCQFRAVKLKTAGKNGLDFYIATECGIISERGEVHHRERRGHRGINLNKWILYY